MGGFLLVSKIKYVEGLLGGGYIELCEKPKAGMNNWVEFSD